MNGSTNVAKEIFVRNNRYRQPTLLYCAHQNDANSIRKSESCPDICTMLENSVLHMIHGHSRLAICQTYIYDEVPNEQINTLKKYF